MGLLICCLYINSVWKKNFEGALNSFNYQILQSVVMLQPHFPSDSGFSSIKWSAARHGFVFLVSGALIYFADISSLLSINMIYLAFTVLRQQRRRKLLNEVEEPGKKAVAISLKATRAVVIYSVFLQIMLFIIYAIRP